MRTSKKGSDWSQLWKRNAVVAAIALFVCAAVYLNWNYGKDGTDTDAGKTLGQSAMVGGKTQDPLLTGDSSAQTGGETGDTSSGTAPTAGEDQGSSGTGNGSWLRRRPSWRTLPPSSRPPGGSWTSPRPSSRAPRPSWTRGRPPTAS